MNNDILQSRISGTIDKIEFYAYKVHELSEKLSNAQIKDLKEAIDLIPVLLGVRGKKWAAYANDIIKDSKSL